MFIIPELEWGAVLLLIPVSLVLVFLPFFLGRRLHVRSSLFQIIVIIAFVIAGLIVSIVPANLLALFGCTVAGTLFLHGAGPASLGMEQWSRPTRLLLLAGVAAALFACLLRLAFGGWLIIAEFGTGFALAPFIFHANLRALSVAAGDRVVPAPLMIASDLLLLAAAAFRIDVGDGNAWLSLLALFFYPGSAAAEPPVPLADLPEQYWLLWNVALFLPVAFAWYLMIVRLLRLARTSGQPART